MLLVFQPVSHSAVRNSQRQSSGLWFTHILCFSAVEVFWWQPVTHSIGARTTWDNSAGHNLGRLLTVVQVIVIHVLVKFHHWSDLILFQGGQQHLLIKSSVQMLREDWPVDGSLHQCCWDKFIHQHLLRSSKRWKSNQRQELMCWTRKWIGKLIKFSVLMFQT